MTTPEAESIANLFFFSFFQWPRLTSIVPRTKTIKLKGKLYFIILNYRLFFTLLPKL